MAGNGKSKEDDIDDKMDEVQKIYPKLEIHHVSVSAGDATIIVARNDCKKPGIDKAYLIDGGNSKPDTEIVIAYFNKIYSGSKFDALILSHDHKDHRGGLPEKGQYFNNSGATFYYGDVIKSHFRNAGYSDPVQINFYDTKEKVIDILSEMTLTCYCAGGIPRGHDINGAPFDSALNKFSKWKDYKAKDFESYKTYAGIKDENDLSLAWILEYKPAGKTAFRYFTAGDLSGDVSTLYTNIERPLLDCLYRKGGPLKDKNDKDITIDVLKATHHGSKHSSFGFDAREEDKDFYKGTSTKNPSSLFLDKIKPKYIVLPCNNSLGDPLPFSEFFDRMKPYIKDDDTGQKVFVVNRLHRDVEKKNKYLKIDFNFWKKVSNIDRKTVMEVNELTQKEEPRTVYTNRLGTEKIKNEKNSEEEYEILPVCIVCVHEDGTYSFDEKEVNSPLGEHSGVKLDKEVKKDLITIIANEYFDPNYRENGKTVSAFEEILKMGKVKKEDIPEIIGLFGEPKQGKRRLVSTDMKSINKFRSFLDGNSMTNVFKDINSRESEESKKEKVEDSVTVFNQNGKRTIKEVEQRKKQKL
jgi:hypothetical protein